MGQLAGARNGDGWFSAAELAYLFEVLRVQPPKRTDNELGRLRDQELLFRRSARPSWSLSPEGSEVVRKLMVILTLGHYWRS